MKVCKVTVLLLPPIFLGGALALPPVPAGISTLLGIAGTGLVLDGLLRPGSRIFAPGLRCAGGSRPRVALTFDDGPHPEDTPAILDILGEAGVTGTFFFVGKKARAHPGLVRRAARAGHQVESHSDTHPWWFSLAGPLRLRREIGEASRTLEDLTGRPVRFFRPPVGHKNLFLEDALRGTGLEVVIWSVRPFDTLRRPPERIRRSVLGAARPGGIILLHEGGRRSPGEPSPTVAALPFDLLVLAFDVAAVLGLHVHLHGNLGRQAFVGTPLVRALAHHFGQPVEVGGADHTQIPGGGQRLIENERAGDAGLHEFLEGVLGITGVENLWMTGQLLMQGGNYLAAFCQVLAGQFPFFAMHGADGVSAVACKRA